MRHRLQKRLFFLVIAYLFAGITTWAQSQFPLHFSKNGRYLITKDEKPFLIKEFSAWGLIQVLSEEDESAFLDSIKQHGFNTILTSIVSNASSQMGGNPPYWNGISPFNVPWDFSTPNELYWIHVDRFLKIAESKGFYVLLVPCYLGYHTDPGQGWWNEIEQEPEAERKMLQYGQFLGHRYENTPNIAWVAGGDHSADGIFEAVMKNIIKGIKKYAPDHLWTGHFDNSSGFFWSTDNEIYRDIIDIDGLYVWKEISLGKRGPHYVTELQQYQNGRMIIQLDQSYEHDVPHYADNENPQWIRRKMYDGLLSGCSGTSFSSGTIDNQCYWFKDWQPLMSTNGMKMVSYCFELFDALPWYKLIPDVDEKIIISGRGNFGDLQYICAAKADDSSFYIMYIPNGRTVFVDMTAMSDKSMRLHWYNPRSGQAIQIGHVGGDPNFGIVTPDEQDWILVFDSEPDWKMP